MLVSALLLPIVLYIIIQGHILCNLLQRIINKIQFYM